MISRAVEFATYCYEAAERCSDPEYQEYLLSEARKWERLAHNFQRDTIAIAESRALLARLAK